jgi:tRNA threonylcarbamoyladenosine biosynthesis protein TsaE
MPGEILSVTLVLDFKASNNEQLTVISRNSEDTFSIGKVIGESLKAGDIVALMGELGAGKTCLTQGIASGLGVPEQYQITSPTFTLINEYPGRLNLYHFDLYRLKVFQEIENMGYEEYLFGEGVSVIEWAEKAIDVLPDETIFISLTYLDENQRKMVISGGDNRMTNISNALKNGGI